MNKDLKIMIGLQRYWDVILENRAQIERANKSIDFWKKDLADLEKNHTVLTAEIKNLKNDIKQHELQLGEQDDKLKKLNERKPALIHEREITAIDKEISGVKEIQGGLEENLIESMDLLDSQEQKETQLSQDLTEKRENVKNDVEKLNNDVTNYNGIITENQAKFDEHAAALSPQVKTRFVKLTQSKKDGKGIGPLNGEVCGICNFQVPSNLSQEAAKEDAIKTCSNCGRYIYLN